MGSFTSIIINSSQSGHKKVSVQNQNPKIKCWNTCYKCKLTLDYWLIMLCEDADANK